MVEVLVLQNSLAGDASCIAYRNIFTTVVKKEVPLGGGTSFESTYVVLTLADLNYRPQAALSSSTRSVFSQVKSGSSRPKWP